MVAGGASGAQSGRVKGWEGGGPHQEHIFKIDLGRQGPEKRIDTKELSSGGAPMATGSGAVDSSQESSS